MGTITYLDCARTAWADAWKVVLRRSPPVALALAALLIANIATVTLSRMPVTVPTTSIARLMQDLILLIRSTAILALPMHVMQIIMIGDHEFRLSSIFGKPFWRYLGLGSVIGAGFCGILVLVMVGGFFVFHALGFHKPGIWLPSGLAGVVTFCLLIFVATRLSLLFCHVAIGGTIRWRASWNDTRGHFWKILLSQLLIGLPTQFVMIAIFLLGRVLAKSMGADAWAYLFAIISAPVEVIGLIVGAACLCLLYRRFAETLLV